MPMYDNKIHPDRAFLVSVDTGDYNAESSLKELYELTKSAGAVPVASIVQKREKPDTATCVGSGCLEEIKQHCNNNDINIIIFDCELSPVQIKNLENHTNIRVIDRTMLILDIFALRAKSKEGKLQVELAQLKYMLPRLTGKGIELSRLGGGIGTRGPGETKLETDKRHIRRKMEKLKVQLNALEKHRCQIRKRRQKDSIITVAIVGYTNAGKSTLMNKLTEAGVLVKDQLFATLDPTSRALKLPSGISVMLIDTVGLVRRLPHHLVEAFKSTLEEASLADIILNVCDASSKEARLHLEVTKNLLSELGCEEHPIIPVMNKCDLVPGILDIPTISNVIRISAKTGEGIDKLLEAIENNLPIKLTRVNLCIPFSMAKLSSEIRSEGTIISEEFTESGLKIEAIVDGRIYAKVKNFIE